MSNSSGRTWRITSGVVLAYEGLAAISKAAKHHGLIPAELPYITELIRPLPRPAKLAATAIVAGAVHDHFDTQRIFR